jgi:RES domain-containing protein
LRPDWSARELSEHFLWKEGLNATPEDAWQRMEGPKGLWAMYQNARVMLEMADYAAKNSEEVDRLLLETLRSDAMQIRLCVLTALCQYAFSQASEGVRVNAFRAASMYTGMAARMTQLLQDHAAVIVPDFVAAM